VYDILCRTFNYLLFFVAVVIFQFTEASKSPNDIDEYREDILDEGSGEDDGQVSRNNIDQFGLANENDFSETNVYPSNGGGFQSHDDNDSSGSLSAGVVVGIIVVVAVIGGTVWLLRRRYCSIDHRMLYHA